MKSGWWSPRAITLHIALVVVVPVFLTLGAWQLSRALHGNLLSWAYTFEWPFFALYATWMWWKLVHEEVAERAEAVRKAPEAAVDDASAASGDSASTSGDGASASVGGSVSSDDAAESAQAREPALPATDWDPYDEADPELAAYNRYLASLHTEQRKR
ncbi:MAG: hypothetical protein ABSB54_04875 [Acidimicrobiales bacterium]|jgi:hypothetical protein